MNLAGLQSKPKIFSIMIYIKAFETQRLEYKHDVCGFYSQSEE